jgi:hypothetical protein
MSESDRTIESEVMPVIVRANSIAIRTAEDYVSASEFLKAIKAAQKRVSDHFEPMKQAAHAAWKKITAKEAEAMEPLANAERSVKALMIEWRVEQDRIRNAEQAKLQAEADERARKEREALEAKAAKMKTESKRDEYLERAAVVVAPIVTVESSVPNVKGQSIRTTWKARLVSLSALTGIPEGDVRLSMVTFDQAAANKLAVATKGAMSVPGVEWYEDKSMSVKGA